MVVSLYKAFHIAIMLQNRFPSIKLVVDHIKVGMPQLYRGGVRTAARFFAAVSSTERFKAVLNPKTKM